MALKKPDIEIYDTTLRDGTQGEGINFSVADKIRLAERFDAFAALPHYPFPGGRLLRVPFTAMGAWYYQMRDKLGI